MSQFDSRENIQAVANGVEGPTALAEVKVGAETAVSADPEYHHDIRKITMIQFWNKGRSFKIIKNLLTKFEILNFQNLEIVHFLHLRCCS